MKPYDSNYFTLKPCHLYPSRTFLTLSLLILTACPAPHSNPTLVKMETHTFDPLQVPSVSGSGDEALRAALADIHSLEGTTAQAIKDVEETLESIDYEVALTFLGENHNILIAVDKKRKALDALVKENNSQDLLIINARKFFRSYRVNNITIDTKTYNYEEEEKTFISKVSSQGVVHFTLYKKTYLFLMKMNSKFSDQTLHEVSQQIASHPMAPRLTQALFEVAYELSDRLRNSIGPLKALEFAKSKAMAKNNRTLSLALYQDAYIFSENEREFLSDVAKNNFANPMAASGALHFATYKDSYLFAKNERKLPTDEACHDFTEEIFSMNKGNMESYKKSYLKNRRSGIKDDRRLHQMAMGSYETTK